MTVDHQLLDSLRTFEHKHLHIRETFLTPVIGGAHTVAVLSEPVADPEPMGWVICHSYGLEQTYMQPLEVELARALSGLGFPVLRFHCQGYGDSELLDEQVTLATHVRDTLDAVQLMHELGDATVGLAGARFGGAVAALVADRIGAGGLILWEPVVKGSAYIRALLRQEAISALHMRALLDHRGMFALLRRDGTPAPANGEGVGNQDPLRELNERGQVELQGVLLTRNVVDEISSLELTRDVSAFNGNSLVVQAGRSAAPHPDLHRLVAHLQALGGSSTLEVVLPVPGESPLGASRFGAGDDDVPKGDRQAQLEKKLIERTKAWAGSLPR